ncbi:hypothetical protein PsAD2_03317 [Pseudovibrio axinellae]|uniref:Lipoprotein n=1 Tax=Pseudovibrio axinellae TaxID=989403 RepID=A0A165WMH5_9HYPH|nr:hypothetical protein [Pseudovibrio axinellae]KZL16701.1 hypothetical protein PsAD2_03317 [Pseudovibrio axinellae]SEQ78200.1 hypothetical protein SAMN05421798_104192 [Pseudovibrio axinellae]
MLLKFQRVCSAVVLAGFVGGCAFGESLTVYEAIEKGSGTKQTGIAELPPESQSSLLSPEQRAAIEANLLAISSESKQRAGIGANFESSADQLKSIAGEQTQ